MTKEDMLMTIYKSGFLTAEDVASVNHVSRHCASMALKRAWNAGLLRRGKERPYWYELTPRGHARLEYLSGQKLPWTDGSIPAYSPYGQATQQQSYTPAYQQQVYTPAYQQPAVPAQQLQPWQLVQQPPWATCRCGALWQPEYRGRFQCPTCGETIR